MILTRPDLPRGGKSQSRRIPAQGRISTRACFHSAKSQRTPGYRIPGLRSRDSRVRPNADGWRRALVPARVGDNQDQKEEPEQNTREGEEEQDADSNHRPAGSAQPKAASHHHRNSGEKNK